MAIDFKPIKKTSTIDFQPIQPTATAQPVQKEESIDTTRFKITAGEIQDIAKKYGMDAKELENLAPYYAGSVQKEQGQERGAGEIAKRTVGELSENVLFNIPQFLYKKSLPENKKLAIDEMVSRMKDRETAEDLAIDLASGLPSLLIPAGLVGKVAQGASKGAQAAARIGGATVIGGLTGLTGSKEGEELSSAALGAGTGLAFGALLDVGLAAARKGKKEVAKVYEEWAAKDGIKLEEKVNALLAPRKEMNDGIVKAMLVKDAPVPQFVKSLEEVPEAFRKDLAEGGVANESIVNYYNKGQLEMQKKDFVNYLLRSEGRDALPTDKAQKEFQDRLATEGPQFLKQKFDNWKKVEAAIEVAKNDLDIANTPKGGFLKRFASRFSDNRPLATIADKRNGTRLEPTLDDISQAQKAYSLELSSYVNDKKKLAERLQGFDNNKIVKAMRADDLSTLNAEEKAIVQYTQELFEQRRLRANELGVPIEKIAGKDIYIPDQMMDTPDVIATMRNMVDKLNAKYKTNLFNVTEDELKQLRKNEDIQNLEWGIKAITHLEDTTSPARFVAGLNASVNPGKASELLDIAASAVQKREGGIPDFLKEKDLVTLLNNWEIDTFRAAYMQKGLEELRTLRQQYMSTGDANAANLVHVLIQDLTGRDRGSIANGVRQSLTKVSAAAKQKIQKGEGGLLAKTLADAPNALIGITNNVYPNFLAWRPSAVLTNAMGPLVMGIPEIGPKYGTQLFAKAYLEMTKDFVNGKKVKLSPTMARTLGKQAGEEVTFHDWGKILKNEGIIGENWNGELQKILKSQAFSKATKGDKILELVGDANEKLNKVGMYLFDKAEQINRYTTNIVGRQLAKDFINRNPAAIKFFNRGLGEGYKRAITEAMKAQDYQKVEDLFSKHLIAKTMFNYDRATMSEIGRYLGPGLSPFLKWPTAIAGDIAASYATRSKKDFTFDISRRYVAPLAALMLMEHMIMSSEDESPVKEYVFGKGGISKAAPLRTLEGIFKGDVGKPPAISTVMDLGAGAFTATQGDPEKLWKWTNNTLQSFAPQAGLVNFLTTGVPTLIEGETPKGTFMGKIEQGLTGDNTLDSFFRKKED